MGCYNTKNANNLGKSEKQKLERIEQGIKNLERERLQIRRFSTKASRKLSSYTITTMANSQSGKSFMDYGEQDRLENEEENLKLTKEVYMNKFYLKLGKDVSQSELLQKRRKLRFWSENVISNKQSPQLKELLDNKNRKLSIQLNNNKTFSNNNNNKQK